jgi:RHS repeat-associated protein
MAWRQGTSPAFGTWAYTHNERGQRLTSTDVTGRVATYAYDAAARLASETVTGDPRGASFNGALSYVLDAVGNRSSRTSTLTALGGQTFTYNANDEISGDTFDPNGNTTASGGHTFGYDFENRLISKDGGAVTLQYDCDGNRVAKTVGGVTTRYLVDNHNPTGYLQVLEEVVGGAVQTRYTYGTSLVSQTRDVSTSPATSFYGSDAHGNITFLTDASGAVSASYDYDAWGNVVASAGSTPNSRLYTGEEFDLDLGLINLRARQYSPSTGRFLTLDPLDIDVATTVSWLSARLANAIAARTQPHFGSVLSLVNQNGVPLTGRLLTPLSLNRHLYAGSDPVTLIDRSGQTFLEDALDYAADLSLKDAAITVALAVAATFAVAALAMTIDDILDQIKKELKDKLGNPADFERCWPTVRKILVDTILRLRPLVDDPDAFNRALQDAIKDAMKRLLKCMTEGGGSN